MADPGELPVSVDGTTPEGADDDSVPWFLRGGGVSGETARRVNWTATPAGPPDRWSAVLKSTLATMFRARQPMFLWWGKELIQFYNDAYLPSFGEGKHPRAMGQAGRECWQEIWPIIGPQIRDVMEHAKSSWNEDALVPICRNGKLEDVFWTYSYSPVFDESGIVVGTLVICTETTARVLAERRNRLLHELVSATSMANDLPSLASFVAAALKRASSDVPFALLCDENPDGDGLKSLDAAGLGAADARAICQRVQTVLSDAPLSEPRLMMLEHGLRYSESHDDPELVHEVFVAPLSQALSGGRIYAIFAITSRLSFNAAYRGFLDQLTAHLQLAVTRVEDATKRAALENERKNLLEQAPVAAALLVGPDHVFEIANPLFQKMAGKQDILGKSYQQVFPELTNSELYSIFSHAYRSGEAFSANEYCAQFNHGKGSLEERFFKFNIEPVRNSRGIVYGLMAVAIEVTDQVLGRRVLEQANAEREELLRTLEEASRAKDEFLAMLGHELRNPLSPILTALELMRHKSGGKLTREQQVIERQATHLVRLVDDLLDVARIARGKVELRRETVDVCDVVSKAVEMASDLLEQGRHRLTIECESEQLFCHGDAVRLSQVIANLLTNAARYTDPGGSVLLRAFAEGEELVISVKDSGIGISEEMLPHVFTLFEQGERPSDRAQGGLGIGLALVSNLVKLHGGSVAAHSRGLGTGSEFTVRLPALGDVERPSQRKPRPWNVTVSGSPKRILVVDDNTDAAELLQATLQAKGHDAAVSTDPLAALELAARFKPEIAILDIGLPVMDGYELAEQIRLVPGCQKSRLIALSGYGRPNDVARGRAAGFEAHLVKPVDFERLLALLENIEESGELHL